MLLYSKSNSKRGDLLFTVIVNSQTTAEISEVITQQLHILPLNLLSKPKRYGKYVRKLILEIVMTWLALYPGSRWAYKGKKLRHDLHVKL